MEHISIAQMARQNRIIALNQRAQSSVQAVAANHVFAPTPTLPMASVPSPASPLRSRARP